ncbi:hypothetical protein [Clostridium culturomicium]|uniref:hypothetical protein n=1 Tax=Clostridium culturomicium TaxID=1499683 RepID=UPI0038572DB5
MNLGKIIKEAQPKVYSKLKEKRERKKRSKEVKFTEKDIKELMSHSSYKRGSGGAIRQVR